MMTLSESGAMRRLRLPVHRLNRIFVRSGVAVVATAATAGALFAWQFRGAPLPAGVEEVTPEPPSIDLIAAWPKHVIVAGASGAGNADGADGVDIGDVNGDGYPDIATGHEQGLRVTVSVNPGPALVKAPWPTVFLGGPGTTFCSAEDAIFGDVDQDGHLDVIAACETGSARVSVLFAPTDPAQLLTSTSWTRVDLTASAGNRSMRAALANISGDGRLELVIGGKESDGPPVAAAIGYYSSATPRTGSSWTFTTITPVGWIMQMYVRDVDVDGDLDIVYSDRDRIDVPSVDNSKRGIRWLENTGGSPPSFSAHTILGPEGDHKWFSLYDWDGDGDLDITDCRSNSTTNTSKILINGGSFAAWSQITVPQPTGVGQCQHATAVDLDLDGSTDLAFSYSNSPLLSGAVWLKRSGVALSPSWTRGEITGQAVSGDGPDVKYDNLGWADLDGDGDLDAILTEQHKTTGSGPGDGVVWFENPLE